ncbi:MAG: toxin-antitoxin system HicB family antitoxin [Coxiellaceae bacterium]|nr:toxin-antitoxin system HicB family antitoxin [Coxiellaceae bacterium]
MIDKYSYRVTWSDDDGEFVGLCAEFPSVSWLSKTQDGAFKGIRKLVGDIAKDMKKQGEVIPEAIATKKFSGKFVVRIPPNLHRELAMEALEAKVSLNRYVAARLASHHK